MNLRLIKLLAKLASRGAGSVPKSATRHARQQSLNKTFPTNRSGGIGNRPNKGPVQQITSPYENRKRQASYNKQGKLGKAISDMAAENIKKNKYNQPSTELRISPFIADLIRNKLKESDNRTFEGLDKNHRLHQAPHYAETNNQHNFKDNEKLIQFLKGLSSEERASWEEEALTKQPKLFDAISGASQ
tara:strand:- start:485 stop:1048 length:564 start_codon:yes stop_codon:yes gene_type:complete